MRIRCGPFIFDADRRELLRDGEAVHLTPRAFQLLEQLLLARPKPVSYETLHDTLWPDTYVSEGSLHNLVHELRRVLGDERREIIRTVYGHGLAFGADAFDDVPASSPCVLTIAGNDIRLNEGENLIGREWDAIVRIDAPSISRRHACIRIDRGRATIEDLGSRNGTQVAGRRLREQCELHHGDVIVFGTVAARFRQLPAVPPTATAH